MHDRALAFGDDATIFLNRARAYYGAGDYVRALEDVDRSGQLNPQHVGMLQLRAQALFGIGQMAPRDGQINVGNNLYRDLERLVALQPADEWAADALATVVDAGFNDPSVFTVIGQTLGDLYTMFGRDGAVPPLIVGLGVLAVLVADLLLWRSSGYWIPRYVHVLALLSLGMMLWINWLWVQAGGAMWTRRYVLIAVVPGLVYFIFITLGGLRAAIFRREAS
jgi:tetratricopeptide (TPR) repeat protein